MTLRFWKGWSIGLRMAFITMLPVALLFTSSTPEYVVASAPALTMSAEKPITACLWR
jgi:hypothetical protein